MSFTSLFSAAQLEQQLRGVSPPPVPRPTSRRARGASPRRAGWSPPERARRSRSTEERRVEIGVEGLRSAGVWRKTWRGRPCAAASAAPPGEEEGGSGRSPSRGGSERRAGRKIQRRRKRTSRPLVKRGQRAIPGTSKPGNQESGWSPWRPISTRKETNPSGLTPLLITGTISTPRAAPAQDEPPLRGIPAHGHLGAEGSPRRPGSRALPAARSRGGRGLGRRPALALRAEMVVGDLGEAPPPVARPAAASSAATSRATGLSASRIGAAVEMGEAGEGDPGAEEAVQHHPVTAGRDLLGVPGGDLEEDARRPGRLRRQAVQEDLPVLVGEIDLVLLRSGRAGPRKNPAVRAKTAPAAAFPGGAGGKASGRCRASRARRGRGRGRGAGRPYPPDGAKGSAAPRPRGRPAPDRGRRTGARSGAEGSPGRRAPARAG